MRPNCVFDIEEHPGASAVRNWLIFPVEPAAIHRQKARHAEKQGCLSSAIRPDNSGDCVPGNFQADLIQRAECSEVLRQGLDSQHNAMHLILPRWSLGDLKII